jgi:hypothetical protein
VEASAVAAVFQAEAAVLEEEAHLAAGSFKINKEVI